MWVLQCAYSRGHYQGFCIYRSKGKTWPVQKQRWYLGPLESVQDSSPEVIDLSENEMLVYHLILWECPLLATGDYFQCFQL